MWQWGGEGRAGQGANHCMSGVGASDRGQTDGQTDTHSASFGARRGASNRKVEPSMPLALMKMAKLTDCRMA